MIYILEYQDYADTWLQAVLEGPADPGYGALCDQFNAALGISELPIFPKFEGQADWEQIRAQSGDQYRAWKHDRNRLVSGRFGGTTTNPDWSAYFAALIQWLCDEHGYRKCEFEEHDTNL